MKIISPLFPRSRRAFCLCLTAAVVGWFCPLPAMAQTAGPYAREISANIYLPQRLVWVGEQPPTEEESQQLLEVLEVWRLNTSQANVAIYRYDPYGNTISSSGTLASANVYRFSSKEIHVNSVMYYYGYRFYDPNLQRWLNRDPFGETGAEVLRHYSDETVRKYAELLPEGHNLYCFVRNNSVSYKDLWGLKLTEQDCQNFLKDCYKNVAQAFKARGAIGLGVGTCVAAGGLAVGKKFGPGAGKLVAGAGAAVGVVSVGKALDELFEERTRCSKLYDRCLQALGLL